MNTCLRRFVLFDRQALPKAKSNRCCLTPCGCQGQEQILQPCNHVSCCKGCKHGRGLRDVSRVRFWGPSLDKIGAVYILQPVVVQIAEQDCKAACCCTSLESVLYCTSPLARKAWIGWATMQLSADTSPQCQALQHRRHWPTHVGFHTNAHA